MTIKNFNNLLLLLLTSTLLLFLTACGGGGGGGSNPQPQKVTVTFTLQGSPPIIYSTNLDVVLPDSFVLELDSSSTNQPTASALALLVAGAEVNDFSYIPATPAINGKITAAIGKLAGFPGDLGLMQISCTYAAGATLPTVDDFIVMVDAGDRVGASLGGITGKIIIDIQPAP